MTCRFVDPGLKLGSKPNGHRVGIHLENASEFLVEHEGLALHYLLLSK